MAETPRNKKALALWISKHVDVDGSKKISLVLKQIRAKKQRSGEFQKHPTARSLRNVVKGSASGNKYIEKAVPTLAQLDHQIRSNHHMKNTSRTKRGKSTDPPPPPTLSKRRYRYQKSRAMMDAERDADG